MAGLDGATPTPPLTADRTAIYSNCSAVVFRETNRGRTNARAACLSLALTGWMVRNRMSPTVYRCLPLRYGKSSLLRRGSRWLEYLRVVGGCYIDRPVFGRWWQAVGSYDL